MPCFQNIKAVWLRIYPLTLIIISSVFLSLTDAYALDSMFDEAPASNNSLDMLNEKGDSGLDADALITEIPRVRLQEQKKKLVEEQKREESKMSRKCHCYFNLCLSSYKESDPSWVKYPSAYGSDDDCRKLDSRSEVRQCLRYRANKRERKKICYEWAGNGRKGSSEMLERIRQVENGLASAIAEEKKEKERLKLLSKQERAAVIARQKQKEELAEKNRKEKQHKAMVKRINDCNSKIDNGTFLCECWGPWNYARKHGVSISARANLPRYQPENVKSCTK